MNYAKYCTLRNIQGDWNIKYEARDCVNHAKYILTNMHKFNFHTAPHPIYIYKFNLKNQIKIYQ